MNWGTDDAVLRVLDRTELLDRLGGDEAVLAEVITLFLKEGPPRVAAVRAALAARDAEAIRTAAHLVKGIALTMAASEVADAASRLEEIGRAGRVESAGRACRALERATVRLITELHASATDPSRPSAAEAHA